MNGRASAPVKPKGSRAGYFAALLFLVVLIGAVDKWTGPDLSFFVFYLVPVGAASLYVGRSGGLAMSAASAVVWHLADSLAGRVYFSPWIGYWNTGMRFAVFVAAALILVRLKRATELEKALARTDPLTGIANSRAFYEIAEREISRAGRTGAALSVAYVDLDGFKQVNDQKGHAEGDLVLRRCAEVISQNIRRSDLAARLGGDEFAVLLPDSAEHESGAAIAKVRARLSEVMTERGWPVTFSIGVVTFPEPPGSVDELIKEADGLMYSVKVSGKDAVRSKVAG